jgi:hypothetical protein
MHVLQFWCKHRDEVTQNGKTDQGSKDIVEEQGLRIGVHGTGKGDTCLLTSRERQAFLADFGEVAGIEQSEVPLEPTLTNDWRNIISACLPHKLRHRSPFLYLTSSYALPKRMLSRMVRLCTQLSCAQYATPPSLGRFTHAPGPEGM